MSPFSLCSQGLLGVYHWGLLAIPGRDGSGAFVQEPGWSSVELSVGALRSHEWGPEHREL